MALAVGDEVAVRALGGKRGTIVTVGRDGRYRVRVHALELWCREDDVAVIAPDARGKPRSRQRRDGPGPHPSESPAAPAGRIDLHGLPVEEAMTRVVAEIDRTLRSGADRIEIVHGIGTGRIKAALHRLLASMPGVARFGLDPRNPGVTWARF